MLADHALIGLNAFHFLSPKQLLYLKTNFSFGIDSRKDNFTPQKILRASFLNRLMTSSIRIKIFLKTSISALVVIISFNATAQYVGKPTDLVEWINPLMGTASSGGLSNGNTYPAIALPWGMNCWTPQTGKMGDGWQYTYSGEKIRGFKQTHQPSPWMNDYGQFSIMPVTRRGSFKEADRASWFSHKSETAKPYYYSVYLADHHVTTEITPTERAASFRFTFPKTDSAFVVIDAFDKGSYIKILPGQNKVVG